MIITENDNLAEKVKKLRVHGSTEKYHHQMVGYNSRLDALQAAVLSAKLSYLDEWSNMRAENANYYTEALSEIGGIIPPAVADGGNHIYHQYTIRVTGGKRDALQDYLKEKNIGTKVYYPIPLHLQPCFQDLGYKKGDFPVSEQVAEQVLSLPIYPELTNREMDYVIRCISEFMN